MTNHWVDMINADVVMIMGGNPAENHPIAMNWIQKTKERGAIILQVDPRFNRTSHIADVWAKMRSGTDIAFVGGMINYALTHDDGISMDYEDADLILVGVSRAGKTPTCVYLALHHGIRAANYPLTPDDLDEERLPAKLRQHRITQAWAGSYEGLLHKNLDGVNARLADECRANGAGILVPFGTVNPALPDWEADLRRCQEKYGMQTFNQSLASLYFAKQISLQTALGISSMPDELQDMINRGAGLNTPQATGRAPARPAGR